MLNNVRAGDLIRAKDINDIIDAVNTLSGETTQRLGGVRISAGPGVNARGNAISVNVPKAKRPLYSGIVDESDDGGFPFVASFRVEKKKVFLTVAGGMWYGNGRAGFNAIPDYDAFSVSESSWEGTPQASFLTLVLYAPARCGVLTEPPAVYLFETAKQDEIVKKIRDCNYSTAAVIGVWRYDEDAGTVEASPGQILKSHYRYSNPHRYCDGFFAWSLCDGTKATFNVTGGPVLLRPHNLSSGQILGDILYMAEKTEASTVKISVPVKSHTLKTSYPESEIEFLKKIVLSRGTSTISADVEIPTYNITAKKKSVDLPSLSAGANLSVKHVTKVALTKATTTVYAKPDGAPTYYPDILRGNGTDVDVTSEIVSFPTYSASSMNVSYVDSVTVSASGKTTVAIDIPTDQTISTEIASVKPLTGVSLETSESTVERELNLPPMGMTFDEPDESTIAAVSAEIFGETAPETMLAPKVVSVPGTDLSVSDSQLEEGAVAWLYLAVKNGNFSASWHVAPLSQPPFGGDIPQTLSLTVTTKTVSATTTAGAGTCAFAVKALVDTSRANSYATAVPMAIIKKCDAGINVQRIREGAVDFMPRLAIEVNKEKEESNPQNTLPNAPGGENSELLSGLKISQSTAQAALEHALAGKEATFPVETADFNEAENFIAQ